MKEKSPNKIKILLVLGAIACIMVPIVLAADWSFSYNSGEEPYDAGSVVASAGIGDQHTTWVSDPITLTNNGDNTWNGNTSEVDDAYLTLRAKALYQDGSTGHPINITAIWVNFPSHPTASHRGWCNITTMATVLYPTWSPGKNGWPWPGVNTSVQFTSSNFNTYGKWVSTENGHTAGNSPTLGYSVANGQTVEFKIIYQVNGEDLAIENFPAQGTYYYSSGATKAFTVQLYSIT